MPARISSRCRSATNVVHVMPADAPPSRDTPKSASASRFHSNTRPSRSRPTIALPAVSTSERKSASPRSSASACASSSRFCSSSACACAARSSSARRSRVTSRKMVTTAYGFSPGARQSGCVFTESQRIVAVVATDAHHLMSSSGWPVRRVIRLGSCDSSRGSPLSFTMRRATRLQVRLVIRR